MVLKTGETKPGQLLTSYSGGKPFTPGTPTLLENIAKQKVLSIEDRRSLSAILESMARLGQGKNAVQLMEKVKELEILVRKVVEENTHLQKDFAASTDFADERKQHPYLSVFIEGPYIGISDKSPLLNHATTVHLQYLRFRFAKGMDNSHIEFSSETLHDYRAHRRSEGPMKAVIGQGSYNEAEGEIIRTLEALLNYSPENRWETREVVPYSYADRIMTSCYPLAEGVQNSNLPSVQTGLRLIFEDLSKLNGHTKMELLENGITISSSDSKTTIARIFSKHPEKLLYVETGGVVATASTINEVYEQIMNVARMLFSSK